MYARLNPTKLSSAFEPEDRDEHSDNSESDSKPRMTRTDSDVQRSFVCLVVPAKVFGEKFSRLVLAVSWRQLVHGREYVMTSTQVGRSLSCVSEKPGNEDRANIKKGRQG